MRAHGALHILSAVRTRATPPPPRVAQSCTAPKAVRAPPRHASRPVRACNASFSSVFEARSCKAGPAGPGRPETSVYDLSCSFTSHSFRTRRFCFCFAVIKKKKMKGTLIFVPFDPENGFKSWDVQPFLRHEATLTRSRGLCSIQENILPLFLLDTAACLTLANPKTKLFLNL